MKKTISLFICLAFLMAISLQGQSSYKSIEEFQNEKLGMFIHWGLYSQPAGFWNGKPSRGGEHFMLYERIPLKEYALIANSFNPSDFDALDMVKKAKNAGMKYIVYTTKHHDGFAMYNSQCSDYNIIKYTAFQRDPLKELAEACKKEGFKLGLYYSLGRDWEDPDVPTNWPKKGGRSNTWDFPDEDAKVLSRYFERKVKPQMKELLTGYGEIAMMWFDTPELITNEQSKELRDIIKGLQPNCLINSRIGNKQGDYSIVEQKLMDKIDNKPWEACLTMGRNWAYNQYDTIYKSPDEMIRHMVDIVSKGGNLLLNVGPTGRGTLPKQTEPIFNEMHSWLKNNGEAIYNTRPWTTYGENLLPESEVKEDKKEFHDAEYDGTPKEMNPDFRFTHKEGTLYIIVRHVKDKQYTIKSIKEDTKVKAVQLLENGKAVSWKQSLQGLEINFPQAGKTKSPIYVLKVTLK